MKPSSQNSDVKILVAEEEIFMRDIIINALATGGYHDVQSVPKLALLQDELETNYHDLLIINGEMADRDPFDIIRRIRLFWTGRNPFVPIIVTSWHSEGPFVRKVLDSGADVMVTKPLAAGKLLARIEFLVKTRPPFVATATYVGPDRRGADRAGKMPQFAVPNTLQERLGGRVFDQSELGARINKVFATIKIQRLKAQENDIGGCFAAIVKAVRAHAPAEDIAGTIDSLVATAVLYARERPVAPDGTTEAVQALASTVKEIAARKQGFSLPECDRIRALIGKPGIKIPQGSKKAAPVPGGAAGVQQGAAG